MEQLPIRIDIGREGESFAVDVWAQDEVSEDGTNAVWQLHAHLVVPPPRIMEKLTPGELDPRD